MAKKKFYKCAYLKVNTTKALWKALKLSNMSSSYTHSKIIWTRAVDNFEQGCIPKRANALERPNAKSDEAIFPDQDKREEEQFYIFYQRESGTKGHEHSSLMTEEIDGMFNLTVSYRTDSDAIRRFGMIEESIQVRILHFSSFY